MNNYVCFKEKRFSACSFCKEGGNSKLVYIHTIDRINQNNGLLGRVRYEHYHYFCDENCANCFILQNTCDMKGYGVNV